MWMLFLVVACNNIEGKWRDYAINTDQLPYQYCQGSDCSYIEQFTLELDSDLNGDFRIQFGADSNHFIYTLPVAAERAEQQNWLVSVDVADYPTMDEEWLCDVTGRLMVCEIGEDSFQFRKGKHP